MNKGEIVKGAVYLSVHNVAYRVERIDGQKVTAHCAVGKSKSFEMSLGRFAETMQTRSDR